MKWQSTFKEFLKKHEGLAALNKAYDEGRIPHAILFTAEDADLLERLALGFADSILGGLTAGGDAFDLKVLRPTNRMRQISAEKTREFIKFFQKKTTLDGYRVGIVLEADRLHASSSNILLKTLEEPPSGSVIILTSTQPDLLLETIRSRCIRLNFFAKSVPLENAEWKDWLKRYENWLDSVCASSNYSSEVLKTYALISNFDSMAKNFDFPALPDLPEEERIAIEAGQERGLKRKMFAEIEDCTRNWAIRVHRDSNFVGPLVDSLRVLSKSVDLTEVNLNSSAALEHFLLSSLKNWAEME